MAKPIKDEGNVSNTVERYCIQLNSKAEEIVFKTLNSFLNSLYKTRVPSNCDMWLFILQRVENYKYACRVMVRCIYCYFQPIGNSTVHIKDETYLLQKG